MKSGKILVASHDGAYILKLEGEVRLPFCATIDEFIVGLLGDPKFAGITVDITDAEYIDSTTLGMLVKLAKGTIHRLQHLPLLYYLHDDFLYLLETMGCADLFELKREPLPNAAQLSELPLISATEGELRKRVLEAHRQLIDLNAKNRLEFRELVESLERGA